MGVAASDAAPRYRAHHSLLLENHLRSLFRDTI